jgi:tRNA/rRNA methyltransferase
MTFWTYMLRCGDGSFYIGHAEDLDARVAEHQHGAIPGYTSSRRPVELVWSDDFTTRDEAIACEQQLKGWSRIKKEALIRRDWQEISAAARKPVLRYGSSTGSAPTQDERTGEDAVAAPPPAIILVRPQLGENIGKAARAMLNFGLMDLRLVAPRDGWPNPSAGPAASGADIVLERARVFDSVAEATADCAHVYATTVRRRDIIKPVVTPEEAAREIRVAPERSAILFGPERSGLSTDDVALARTIVTVPINAEFGSLNLAQAVILLAYEWSKGADLAQPPTQEIAPPAPQADLEGLIEHLDRMLVDAGYFFPPDAALDAHQARLECAGGAHDARRADQAGSPAAAGKLTETPSAAIGLRFAIGSAPR